MKKMLLIAAFTFMSGLAQAQGVKLTELNPIPPRTYTATGIAELFEKEFEIRVSGGSKPELWKYRLHDYARYDELLTNWFVELAVVPVQVHITYRVDDTEPEVRIVFFDRYLNLRVRHENLSFDNKDALTRRANTHVWIRVKLDTFPRRFTQSEIDALLKSLREGKPFRFHGQLNMYATGDTFEELERRLSDMTLLHIKHIEDPQTKPEEPAGKLQDKCPPIDGCHP